VDSVEYAGQITSPTADCIGIGAILDNAIDPNDPTKVLCENALADTPGFWTGLIDDIGLWTRTLGADEVLKIYQAGLAGKDLTAAGGTPQASTLHATISGGQIHLTWDHAGKLQSRSTITGAWQDVPGVTGQSADLNITGSQQYFQVVGQ